MEAIEVMVFITIAIIVGGMVIGFVLDWDFEGTYNSLQKIISGDSTPSFTEVNPDTFIQEVLRFWKFCGYGELNDTLSIYVLEEGVPSLDKPLLFEKLKKFNICNSLQSAANDCGVREDVEMGTITLPAVVTLECVDINNTLVIS